MATNFISNSGETHKNPILASQDPRAVQLDEFLTEFEATTPGVHGNRTDIMEADGTLRHKVDAIADRVRHSTQRSTHNPDGDREDVHPNSQVITPDMQELPVKTRLDTMEFMLREIKDSIKNTTPQQAQPGQLQPRVGPLGPTQTARDLTGHVPTYSQNGQPGYTLVESGLAQPQGQPLGRPVLASDGVDPAAQPRAERDRHYSTQSRNTHRGHRVVTRRDPPAYPERPTQQDRTRRASQPPLRRPAYRRPERHARAPLTRDTQPRRPHQGHDDTYYMDDSSSTESDNDTDTTTRQDDHTTRRVMDNAIARQYQTMGKPTGRVHDHPLEMLRPHQALPPDMRR